MLDRVLPDDKERGANVMRSQNIRATQGEFSLGPSSKVMAMNGPWTCTAL
jgi:hypothetical protein